MGAIRFQTRLERRARLPPLVFDDAQVAAVGEGAKRFAVVATVGDYNVASVARMGDESLLGLSREVRPEAST